MVRALTALLCLLATNALQPQLYIAGIDATLPAAQQRRALIAALGGESEVEAVDLFVDKDFAFATMRSEAAAAKALAQGARRPLFAAVERARSPRPRRRRTLESGALAGAALDSTAVEPLPKASRLWSLRNVILTPHASALSAELFERRRAVFEANLDRFLRGDALENAVDMAAAY